MVAKFLRFGSPKTDLGLDNDVDLVLVEHVVIDFHDDHVRTPVTGHDAGAIVEQQQELPGALEPRSL